MAGLGHWGKNLVRNFDDLAELRALCDVSPETREEFARRYPNAHVTDDFGELLADPEVEAIVIATPVPTHYSLAKQALQAGKHVFVEKPPAMRGEEMEELVALAEERELTLMPGHLLLYHPGVRTVKELVDAGALGDVLCVYGNRQNLGIIRKDENALWSLGVHDLSVILYLLDEEPSEAWAHGNAFLTPGVEDVVFCYLRFPSGRIAHMHLSWLDPHKMRRITVVGRDKMVVFDDMELERKITVYEKGPWQPAQTYGEWQTRTGDIYSPKIPNDEPLKLECQHFLALVRGEGDRAQGRARRARGRAHARAAAALPHGRTRVNYELGANAVVYPGTVIGDGCKIGDNAVVGKQPTLSARSTAKREPLEPLELGPGTIVSTGAIVFAGTKLGARVIVGDGARVRERCVIGDDVVIGSGSLVENDTTIGARTTIQAEAYITAYSTLEDQVFIAPCVVTTNDNFMGRTEKRHELVKGPTIRRGARVGGGAILCPGVEIGEEAFVGAGAVVTKDVPPRVVVVGNPARVLRDVPAEELL